MYISKWISPLLLFIYSSAAVFIIVGGQSTTGVDSDSEDQLANTVAMLEAQLAKLAARNEKLEAEHAEVRAELAKTVDEMAKLEETTPNNGKCCFLVNL